MASNQGDSRRLLVITADDYGYWPSYNQGILEAIEMGAIDSVSAMVEREYCEPEPLLESGVEIGLHIEFEGRWGPRSGAPARTSLRVQLERFGDLFGRWPSFLNGHTTATPARSWRRPVFQMAQQIERPGPLGQPGPPAVAARARHRHARPADRAHATASSPPSRRSCAHSPPGVTEWVTHPGPPGFGLGLELRHRPPGGPGAAPEGAWCAPASTSRSGAMRGAPP